VLLCRGDETDPIDDYESSESDESHAAIAQKFGRFVQKYAPYQDLKKTAYKPNGASKRYGN
jgi:hypothetical protein